MNEWNVGDDFEHAEHGRGTVTFVGADYIGVRFDDGRDAMLRMAALKEACGAAAPSVIEQSLPIKDACWPGNTFIADREPERRSMGSHWQPFVEDAADIFTRLPELLPRMDVFRAYGDFFKPPRAVPDTWPEGFALCWPDVHGGVVAIVRREAKGNELVSLFPYHERGIQTRLELSCVHVWDGGLEAQIEADWNGASVTFFDAAFVANRSWYEAGKVFDFILLGIAYSAGPPEIESVPFNPHPDEADWLAALGAPGAEALPMPKELKLAGMTMLVPVPQWDRDDCQFRGSIKEVTDVPDLLGQPAWRLVVTVMRLGSGFDEDADLAVLVTRRAWRGEQAPVAGMEVDGTLWLQGRLWQPVRGAADGRR